MHRRERLREEVLDDPAEELIEVEAEEGGGVIVDENDLTGRGHDQRCVRGGVEQRPGEIVAVGLEQRRSGTHATVSLSEFSPEVAGDRGPGTFTTSDDRK